MLKNLYCTSCFFFFSPDYTRNITRDDSRNILSLQPTSHVSWIRFEITLIHLAKLQEEVALSMTGAFDKNISMDVVYLLIILKFMSEAKKKS